MKTLPRIAASEWEIMTVLWEHGGLSSTEIVAGVTEQTEWSQSTIRTLLQRLVRKGVVACDTTQRPAIYRAAVSREASVRRESQSLLLRAFKGAQALFVINLMKEAEFTRAEIEELKRILKEKEGV